MQFTKYRQCFFRTQTNLTMPPRMPPGRCAAPYLRFRRRSNCAQDRQSIGFDVKKIHIAIRGMHVFRSAAPNQKTGNLQILFLGLTAAKDGPISNKARSANPALGCAARLLTTRATDQGAAAHIRADRVLKPVASLPAQKRGGGLIDK